MLNRFDLKLLTDSGFQPSPSGASWFAEDKNNVEWQAYIVEGDHEITFERLEERGSMFLEREQFEELFV